MVPKFAWWFGVLATPFLVWDRWPRASAAVAGVVATVVVGVVVWRLAR